MAEHSPGEAPFHSIPGRVTKDLLAAMAADDGEIRIPRMADDHVPELVKMVSKLRNLLMELGDRFITSFGVLGIK